MPVTDREFQGLERRVAALEMSIAALNANFNLVKFALPVGISLISLAYAVLGSQ